MLHKIDTFLGSFDSAFLHFFETYPNIAELFPLLSLIFAIWILFGGLYLILRCSCNV